MDSDNYFGYDDFQDNENDNDDEYNALNDETFGSAAVVEDWEDNHEQLAFLNNSERLHLDGKKNSVCKTDSLFNYDENIHTDSIENALKNISIDELPHKRLFERSSKSLSFSESGDEDHILGKSTSIWSTPTNFNSSLPSYNLTSKSTCLDNDSDKCNSNLLQSNDTSFPVANRNGLPLPSQLPFGSFKTVSEIEEEMKRQHQNDEQSKHSPMQYLKFRTTDALPRFPLNQTFPPSNDRLNRLTGPQIAFSRNPLLPTPQANIPRYNMPYGMNPTNVYAMYGVRSRIPWGPRPVDPRILHMQRGNIPFRPVPGLQLHPPHMYNVKRPVIPNSHAHLGHRMESHIPRSPHRHENGFNVGIRQRWNNDLEWKETQHPREVDEYAGLMTPYEKSWLCNIQTMQLQAENPYEDDYYFVMFKARKQKKRDEEVIEISGAQLLSDKGKDGSEYVPPNLENSLGKLQVVNFNAPRKIIDLQVLHLDPLQQTTSLQRDMRKHRQLLLRIEKLFDINIELEDFGRKVRALPDCPARDRFRSTGFVLVKKLWEELTTPHDFFVRILCIRKGKVLTSYLMNWLQYEELEHILSTVIQNWLILSKKDSKDKVFSLFWPATDRFLSFCSTSTILSFAQIITKQLETHKNKFLSQRLFLNFILDLVMRGEQVKFDVENQKDWLPFMTSFITSLAAFSDSELSALELLPSVNLIASFQLILNHVNWIEKLHQGDPKFIQSATAAVQALHKIKILLGNIRKPE